MDCPVLQDLYSWENIYSHPLSHSLILFLFSSLDKKFVVVQFLEYLVLEASRVLGLRVPLGYHRCSLLIDPISLLILSPNVIFSPFSLHLLSRVS